MAVSRKRVGTTSRREKRATARPVSGSGDKFAEESFPNVVLRPPTVKRSAGKRSRGKAKGG
jgi:hypothetical protein